MKKPLKMKLLKVHICCEVLDPTQEPEKVPSTSHQLPASNSFIPLSPYDRPGNKYLLEADLFLHVHGGLMGDEVDQLLHAVLLAEEVQQLAVLGLALL